MHKLLLALVLPSCTHTPVAPPPVPATPEPPAPKPPVAEVRPVTDDYHGTSVADPYRWLEGDDAEVKAWSDGQNQFTRSILDPLPVAEAIRQEVRAVVTGQPTYHFDLRPAGGKLFAMRKQPSHEQPELVVIDDPAHAEAARPILDPAASGGATVAIDWYRPSPDGTKVAVSLSTGGSEEGTLHVIGLDGKDLEAPIPNVQRGTGGGDAAWTPDGKGLYYTRYPAEGEKPADERDFWMHVWYHTLGQPVASDRYEMGEDLPKIAEITLASDPRGRVLASVQNGDGGTFRHYLRPAKGGWRQLDDWSDAVVSVDFGPTEDLWLVSRKDAPRGKILKLSGSAANASAAKVVVPEGKDTVLTHFADGQSLLAEGKTLYVVYQLGGPTELRTFSLAGAPQKVPALPPVSAVGDPVPWGGGVLFGSTSYTTPWTWRTFDPLTGAEAQLPALAPPPPVDLSAFDVVRETATSADGTAVPLTVVWPKGAPKDGTTPCVAYGYGGYGVSQDPEFLGILSPLLKRGVCYAVVNLRGGGEFGEAWHAAGALTHKQNVFDDFVAALHLLIDQKYTSPEHLAILGGSNGGLLMGATLTQHPELVHAAVSKVGIYDMLRVERSPNGAYNVTEFGTVADEAQFAALYAYSPYHHVTAGTKYPAILMTTGANDPRVSPWQSRKMVAALQAAQAADAPILLRTSNSAGHGMGSSMEERIALNADVQAFLVWQLGR